LKVKKEVIRRMQNTTGMKVTDLRLLAGSVDITDDHQLWFDSDQVCLLLRVTGGGKRFRSCSSDEEEPEPPRGPKFLKATRCRDPDERKENLKFNAQLWATYHARERARSAGWVTKQRQQESDDESDEDIGVLTPKYVEPMLEVSAATFMARFSSKK